MINDPCFVACAGLANIMNNNLILKISAGHVQRRKAFFLSTNERWELYDVRL